MSRIIYPCGPNSAFARRLPQDRWPLVREGQRGSAHGYRKYMREFGVLIQFCLAHLIRDVMPNLR